jgi:3-phenylpropionate/trans-cinnamate dioxygenase ferredoxin reductase subunit
MSTTAPCIAIIGAGQAGARAALGLREHGWTGRIVLIGDEAQPPYERPPLSKKALTDSDFCLQTLTSAQQCATLNIELRLATRVTAVDIDTQTLQGHTAGGESFSLRYDQLLWATGGRARSLTTPGAEDPRVHVLRRASDAQALAAQLQAGRTLLVVGGGFIGLEVAASARQRGCEVLLLETGPRLLRRTLSEDLAAQVQALHRSHGVDLRLQDGPLAFVPDGAQLRVTCRSGRELRADVVVAGIGMEPEVGVARAAGLTVNRGIVVDACLRSTVAPNVLAIGDVCEFPSADGGATGEAQTTSLESWQNAQAQADVAVANLMGGQVHYRPEGWMWSDQYDHTLQLVGQCGGAVQLVSRPQAQGELQFFLNDRSQVVGAAGWGPTSLLAKDFLLARRLVAGAVTCTASDLAQPEVPLKRVLSGARNSQAA